MNFRFGVDYYPEHWPESRWETDARLMQEMGLQVVRLAEFAWNKLEPAAGRFDFAWLDRAIAVLAARGLKVVLGTPSAAPPAWMIEAHPDILPVDSEGRTRGFGGRHHDCQSNPTYRRQVARIVTAMAEHYGGDSRVVGWQTDNELGNSHQDTCHCGHCRRAFQTWLERRYGSIGNLNQSWGTVFWSQTYDTFAQVPTPALTLTAHSPSLLLDWKRFHSDLIVDFQQQQIDLLRPRTPGQFLTHNFMGYADVVDYFDLAAPLDFVSHDQYPSGFWDTPPGRSPAALASALDLMAGLKGKAFWIMEQQAGPTGWQIMARTPRPGQLALWAAQSVARGADTVVFFRWRSCTVGTEQYWHGILPHNGVPGRRYQELRTLVQSLSPVMPRFEGALPNAEVALLHSYEQNWAFEIQPHHPELDYVTVMEGLHAAFYHNNVPAAFVSPQAELAEYKLVVAPLLFLDLPGVAERLKNYVERGGHLVLTARTGVKNQANVCLTDAALPGPYGELLGIEILDYDCLRGIDVPVAAGPVGGQGRLWWDVVTLRGATVIAKATGGDHDSEPAATGHAFGKGSATYWATLPDATLAAALVEHALGYAKVSTLGKSEPGVELAQRRSAEGDFLFALNHTAQGREHQPGASWTPIVGTQELAPFGFSVFFRPAAHAQTEGSRPR
jgi:beta-galactosidase